MESDVRRSKTNNWIPSLLLLLAAMVPLLAATPVFASEADLAIPDLHNGSFHIFGSDIKPWNLLAGGACIIAITLGFSLYLRWQIHRLPSHKSMLDVAEVIYQTCKTYLIQQGKFLLMLFVIMGSAMTYYFVGLQDQTIKTAAMVLFFSIVGMVGSYSVAWYGIRASTPTLIAVPPSPRCAASRGTWSTFHSEQACP
jgi:K(+)-stimulated pyrophosphate-energized sodium pump